MSGEFTQSASNLMHALLYFENQQPQAWHESLETIWKLVIRFNITTTSISQGTASTFQVLSML